MACIRGGMSSTRLMRVKTCTDLLCEAAMLLVRRKRRKAELRCCAAGVCRKLPRRIAAEAQIEPDVLLRPAEQEKTSHKLVAYQTTGSQWDRYYWFRPFKTCHRPA